MKLNGVTTALITPFLGNEVDFEGLRKNIRFQIKNHVDGLLVLGTTGESPTLSHQEKDAIIQCAVEEAKGDVPIMVGTGGASTAQTLDATLRAKELGADCALIVTPFYEGVYDIHHLRETSGGLFHPDDMVQL